MYICLCSFNGFQCDLSNVSIDTQKLNEFCHKQKFIAWFPTSAKDDINVGE